MITNEQLAEWERLASEATPGPWTLESGWEQSDPGLYITGGGKGPGEGLVYASGDYGEPEQYIDVVLREHDAAFAVAAREAVPVLVEEVRRLRAIYGLDRKWDERSDAEFGVPDLLTIEDSDRVRGE